METKKWPVEQKLQYVNLIYHHIIQNSDENTKIEQLIKEQKTTILVLTFMKIIVISDELGIDIRGAKTKKKSKWKIEIKKTLRK